MVGTTGLEAAQREFDELSALRERLRQVLQIADPEMNTLHQQLSGARAALMAHWLLWPHRGQRLQGCRRSRS